MPRLHALEKGGQSAGLWLPPHSARQWDVGLQGRIETPLDSRGLVDLDKLVVIGKQTIDEDFDWTSLFNDIHHLQWPGAFYADASDVPEVARDFRELVRRKAYLPRLFHNWLHTLTVPPPVPTEEVMRISIEAERIARAIAATAQLAVRLTRMRGIPEAKLTQRLEQQFDNYTIYVENARLVPIEFQLLKLAEVEASNVDEMLAANKRLGKMALNHVPIRFRQLQVAAEQ